MKKLIILIIIALSITSILFAQKTPFEKFNKNRIDVGTLYIYEYSRNKKDFVPVSKRYIYIKTLNNIEDFIIPIKDTTDTWLERIKINWDYMMLDKRSWVNLKDKDSMGVGASLEGHENIDLIKKTLNFVNTQKFKEGFKKKYYTNKFKSIPSYFYSSTDLLPLWFALRFYPLNKKIITVNSMTNGYNTKFEIKYEGKEEVDVPYGKILSYKFELIPKLSFFMKIFSSSKKAFIWLSAENNYRYMVKYRNNNEQNTFIQSIEYRLAERRKMTPEEWEKFKEMHRPKDTNSTN